MNEVRAVLLNHLKMPGVPSQLVFWILTASQSSLVYFSVVLVFHMHLKICSILVHTRRSNQSILKEINSEYSLEGMMLKLQYFGNLMWRANSLEKTLMLGKIEGRWRRTRALLSLPLLIRALILSWGNLPWPHLNLCCCCSDAQSCLTLCNPTDCSTPGLPVHHQLPEFTQTHVHWVGDVIQPSHPLSSPSPACNLSQHQGLFPSVGSLHQVAKGLEFQLQHQSFQWIFRVDFL